MAYLEKRNSGTYSLLWTDRKNHAGPSRESLETKKQNVARERKKVLEYAYKINRHNPWQVKWYDSPDLREAILTGNLEDIYEFGKSVKAPSLFHASERYIHFKTNAPGHWDSNNSAKNKSGVIRRFRNFVEDKQADQVGEDEVIDFIKREELSDHTIQGEIRVLNTFFNWCKKKGWHEGVEVSSPNAQTELPDFIYNDELKKICLYKIDKEYEKVRYQNTRERRCQWWHPLFWILLARTGMRPSELIAVRLEHIEGYDILVRKGTRGKSQAAKRRVPVLAQEAKQCLDALTNSRIRARDEFMSESSYLFGRYSQNSQNQASSEFTEAVKSVLKRDDFKMRHLRNVFAFWMLTLPGDSMDLKAYKLKRMMGHKTDDMTQRYQDALPYNPDKKRLHEW